MPRPWLLVSLVLLSSATDAWALKPGKHRTLLEDACGDAGLPDAFCRRAGKQVYEVDYYEWTALSAHAQRERGQDRCAAADAAIARVDALAREVADDVLGGKLEEGAIALGRAVHTLQDECAHHGMTNEEHAFYSLEQTCGEGDVSPDIQPQAVTCADARTRDALARVADALAGAAWSNVDFICRDSEDRDTCATAVLPTPGMACSFLKLHTAWDGDDSTWNGDVVGPALAGAFANGLAGGPAPAPLCGGDASAIDPVAPRTHVTDQEAGCKLADAICLGKVDEDGEPIAGDDDASGGCSTDSGGSGATGGLLALFGLALVMARRRS